MGIHTVHKATIDGLVNAALQLDVIATAEEGEAFGRVLWQANHQAVNRRYQEATDTPPYVPTIATGATFDPVAVVKLLRYFVYQTDEHPEWPGGEASACLDRLNDAALAAMSTYEATALVSRFSNSRAYNTAPWGISDLSQMPTRNPSGKDNVR